MLNPFPIQFLAPLAYTLLRICVGALLVRMGFRLVATREIMSRSLLVLGFFEIILGTLFIVGYGIQVIALITILLSLVHIVSSRFRTYTQAPQRAFYILLLGASLSLFITGGGAFGFDLPI